MLPCPAHLQLVEELHSPKELKKHHWPQCYLAVVLDGGWGGGEPGSSRRAGWWVGTLRGRMGSFQLADAQGMRAAAAC